jgi:hypothetical protein
MCPLEPNLIFDRDPKNVIKLKLKDFELKKPELKPHLKNLQINFTMSKPMIKHTSKKI